MRAKSKMGYTQDTAPSAGFREKLGFWLKNARSFPEYYEDAGYDPNDYSVDEWEIYLKKKNNNLNFEQFLQRKRWSIKAKIYDDFVLDEFCDNFVRAAANCHEFLSKYEMNYVERFVAYLKERRGSYDAACSAANTMFEAYGEKSDEYKGAVIKCQDILRAFRFCCRWKFIAEDGQVPADIAKMISAAIVKEIDWRKRRWVRMSASGYRFSEIGDWDVEKIRLYKVAVKYGALLPEHIDTLKLIVTAQPMNSADVVKRWDKHIFAELIHRGLCPECDTIIPNYQGNSTTPSLFIKCGECAFYFADKNTNISANL